MPSETNPANQPLRVVVAEDEALIRLDLVEMLEDNGYDVVAAVADGEAAVAAVTEHVPDLALFDVKMPRKDGISAAEEVGAQGLTPVVLLTAFSDKHLVERASDAGVMGYVVKPFTWNDLGPALTVAVGRGADLRDLRRQLRTATDKLESRKQLDRAKGLLIDRLGLDEQSAFRWIQKTAMDQRMSMGQVCAGVIREFGDGPSS